MSLKKEWRGYAGTNSAGQEPSGPEGKSNRLNLMKEYLGTVMKNGCLTSPN